MRISKFVRTSAAVGIVAGFMFMGASSASAQGSQTVSDTVAVTASVIKNCKVTTSPVSFAAYDVLSLSDTDATGGVTIACTKGVSARVSLDGNGILAGPSGAQLTYQLFQNSGRTTSWNTVNFATYASTTRVATPLTVFARIPKDQDVPEGSYSATVTAAINF